MKVSIITVNYNNEFGLKRTLESIKSQIFMDYELLVIDGASSDNSVAVIHTYSKKITSMRFVSEKDEGIYNAMNKGTDMAIGDYLIFMNSGDRFYDDQSLEQSAKFLDGEVIVIEELVFGTPKTKEMATLLKNMKVEDKKVLFVVDQFEENVILASRNLQNVALISSDEVNVLDIVNSDVMVMTEKALKDVEEVLK